MKTTCLIVFTFCFCFTTQAQNEIRFLWDKNYSPIASAENLISIHKSVYEFENKILKLKYWKEDNWKRKAAGIGYRLGKTLLLEGPIDALTIVHQHEVFGHGFRYREFGYTDSSYRIRIAPPYGSGGGFARRGEPEEGRFLGAHENIVTSVSGMGADGVLASTLSWKWMSNGIINYRESHLYLYSFHDLTAYILSTKFINSEDSSGDVNRYLSKVNTNYGYFTESNYELTLNNLARKSYLNLFNTFQLFAAYTYLKTYLYDGEEFFEFPMVNLGNIKWLPSVRFGLTPFGSEFFIENYFKKGNQIAKMNVRLGDNQLDKFWGGGLTYQTRLNENLSLNSSIDFWSQPSMELGGQEIVRTKEGFGGRFVAEVNAKMNKDFPVGLLAQVGYKTAGFIEGEQLDKGLILRIGMSIRIAEQKENTTEN